MSRVRWQNTYNFGDFHGDENRLLKYYDAHFYTANWGTVRLGLAFPKGCLSAATLEPYLRGGKRYEDTLSFSEVGDRFIIWWERNQEDGWEETQGEGTLDQLLGIREELMRADYRALFLGWLANFHPDEWQDPKNGGVRVPPIPAGLDCLTPALDALIEHFAIDRDALAVAAGLSQAANADRIPVAAVLERLPVSEMRALLERVAAGDGSRVMSELNRLTNPAPATPTDPTMSCTDLAAKTLAVRAARRAKRTKAEEAKRKAEEEARRQRLASIMQRADKLWVGLDPLMEQKTASAYDLAAAEVQELRDAYEQAGESAKFQQKLTAFRERYVRQSAMLRRIGKL